MKQESNNKITNSQYDDLISNSLKNSSAKEKSITLGKIISIENEIVTIDVGLKSEGRIPLSEFSRPGQKAEIEVGDETEVFIENVDNANGETLLSREKAVKQKAWHDLQLSFNENKFVTGVPFNRVKGAMIKISAQLFSSMWRGVDWLFDHWSFSKMQEFLLKIERESGFINFSAFWDKTHFIS